jgi:hypothetical protein
VSDGWLGRADVLPDIAFIRSHRRFPAGVAIMTLLCARSSTSFRLLSIVAVFAATTFLGTAAARADGLFYQLPPDGASMKFDLEMTADAGGEQRTSKGSLTMSSVGQVESGGEKSRWIEFKMVMQQGDREQVIIAKSLIPEKSLKLGESPFANFTKAWLKQGDREPKEIKEAAGNDAGPLPAFLAGPLNNQQKLEAIEVDSVLGKLQCAGVTGDLELDEGNNKVRIEFENRLSDKAPFGVVTSTMKFNVTRDGQQRDGGTLKLKAAEIKKDAKSELPDLN